MISLGGVHKVTGGSGLLDDRIVIEGETSSVIVRFVLEVPPWRNSDTDALTVTESPTLTGDGDEVNTKIPSDVSGSSSGAGSCMKNPLEALNVTIPGTFPTG